MKNFLIYGLIIALILSGISCQKFLTKDIQGVYPADQFYQTSNQAIAAINAAYEPLTFTNATQNPLGIWRCFLMSCQQWLAGQRILA